MTYRTALKASAKACAIGLITLGFASGAAAQGLEWGSFKDNGCIGKSGQRSYSSVLWNIPDGQDWEATCLSTPARFQTRSGAWVSYPEPSACTKTTAAGALSVASIIIGVPGVVYKPVGALSLALGAGAFVVDEAGAGALNVWGVFNMEDPSCIGYKRPGHIQDIDLVRRASFLEGDWTSVLSQSVARGTHPESNTRVCFRNHTRTNVMVTHDYRGVGTFRDIGKFGGEQCATFRSSARVGFVLWQDGKAVETSKQMTMSLSAFAGDTLSFEWRE